jgi:allantoicase
VVSLDEPRFDEDAYSHIGKTYEGVEPFRMGGHRVTRDAEDDKVCVHHFDPNHRECFEVELAHRTHLETLCISTRFFAGNPGSDLVVTLIDDLSKAERRLPIPHLQPDAEHWIDDIHFNTTRMVLHFKAGGITRIWAFGPQSEQQPEAMAWLSKNSTVVFQEDDFFGGPDFALSDQANRSNPHMLGWETSRSAMGLQAVFPIEHGTVKEIVIDTYRHVNNYLRSAWVFSANLSDTESIRREDCPQWQVTSSDGDVFEIDDLKTFFAQQHQGQTSLPTYSISAKGNDIWTLQTTLEMRKDALHRQSGLDFEATHICIMLLPHGGLHAIRVMGRTL